MTRERKKGQLTLEGANPMSFVEVNEGPSEPWSPQQEAIVDAVSSAVKSYLKNTETLASEKYAHLRDKIPEYLSNPGQVLVAVCNDGVVIRYEKKIRTERKLAITVMRQGIAEVAALLSQNLVHIQSPDSPLPQNENFGVEFKLTLHSPSAETSKDIIATRIWFQVRPVLVTQEELPGAKPYCLLSVRNGLVLEIHGELVSEAGAARSSQPFIARSPMRLMAGWDCIEVFPGFKAEMWNANFAPLWAESDVLSAALIAHSQDAQLSTLDPRASARRQYAALLAAFKALLDSNPEREQALQAFLQENPVLLCPTHVRVWPKLALGSKVTDFVFCDATQDYLLVEIERSILALFRQDGHPTAHLTHAHGQIIDWKRYLEDNLQSVQRELGLTGITANPNGLLVIGRSRTLSVSDRRKLQTMTNESPKLRIMTYDDVYENAKAVFENLLGPIWDTGGDTQIYYPRVS
jgi:antiviral defense system Shedu protein SduA